MNFTSGPNVLDHSEMHFNFTWSSFNESAWRSARDTGALAHMPASETQTYADSYAQQDLVNKEAVSIFTHQSEMVVPLLMTPATETMRPEEVTELLHEPAVTYVRLNTLKQLIGLLENNYKESLRK